MLTDKVWEEASEEKESLLCLPCVQSRLDRPLVREDFPDVPINDPIFAAMKIGKGPSSSGPLPPAPV